MIFELKRQNGQKNKRTERGKIPKNYFDIIAYGSNCHKIETTAIDAVITIEDCS